MLPDETMQDRAELLAIAAEFRHALRRSVFMVRRLDAGADLTAAQLSILNMVADESVRVSTVAANLGVKTPSATEAIKKLEAQGYLQRRMDPADSRAVLVTLTEAGKAATERSNERRDELVARILATLPPADRERLSLALPIITSLSDNFIESL